MITHLVMIDWGGTPGDDTLDDGTTGDNTLGWYTWQ